ncbi:MAG TPA: hypothetical protein VH143_11330 [Kofleriaceae bacterium]|jgi:hypothetical protein|nr:hypothetical protein [Kofleriaceae bacterium]
MVDQELDALLVGALYGELGPADEARLAAHLESHPTDRTALDDLRSTRKALVEARFFELWFEPPPAVSALLVQEAARRAPRSEATGDSWFARFVRSFMSHPAMAAAAMLVVVVGVAGTLYMKKGADLAEPSAPVAVAVGSPSASVTSQTTPTVAYGSAADTPPSAASAAPTGNTKVADSDGISADVDDKRLALDRARDQSVVAKKPTAEHAIKQGVEVAPKRFEPKELAKDDSGPALAENEPAKDQQGYNGKAAPPASAPQTSMATVGTATTGAAGGDAAKATDRKAAEAADPWAREQHDSVAQLVRKGSCQEAATVAAAIQARSPEYYAINIANDRTLRQCASYIADAVEKQEQTRAKAAAKAVKASDSK